LQVPAPPQRGISGTESTFASLHNAIDPGGGLKFGGFVTLSAQQQRFTSLSLPEGLLKFFQSYRDGFDASDGDAISSHYRTPVSILDGDGLRSYIDHAALLNKFQATCDAFRTMGYQYADFRVGQCISHTDNAATVDVVWRVHLATGVLEFRTTYVCVCVEERWQIMNAVAYGDEFIERDG
jgi:hypothetical protein